MGKLKWLFILLFFVLTFFALNKQQHFRSTGQNYREALFADKAGYNIYLPSLFYWGLTETSLNDSIVEYLGKGFSISGGKVQTKYPYGVALFQSPFFAFAHIESYLSEGARLGFSWRYRNWYTIANVFYCTLGLYFFALFLFEFNHFKAKVIWMGLALLLLGTNLYYYTVVDIGMSHVISFALFSFFLYRYNRFFKEPRTKEMIVLAITAGLVIAVRPINVLFVLTTLGLWSVGNWAEFKNRVILLLKPKHILTFFIAIVLFQIPQWLYNKAVYESYFVDSYKGESFDFTSPYLLEHLFDTMNGLFVFSPFAVLMIIGMIMIYVKKKQRYYWIPLLFGLLVYVFSSWHAWHFGCALGQRVYVEYYILFLIPVLYLLQQMKLKVVLPLIAIIIYINLSFSYNWSHCHFIERGDYIELYKLLL